MTTPEVRAAFAAFCGVDQYRRFVRVLNPTPRGPDRLMYWQEALWEGFAFGHQDLKRPTFADLRDMFRVCDVHGTELLRDAVPIVYGGAEPSADFSRAADLEFPFAQTELRVRCALPGPNATEVDYCTDCRIAKAAWMAAHAG